MSRFRRPLKAAAALLFSWGGLFSGALRAETGAVLQPPTSIRPGDTSVSVHVVHRHRAIRECLGRQASQPCTGREVDADTATSVRLTRVGVVKATVGSSRDQVQVTFPNHVGPQEQAVQLRPGDWIVDWPGAPTIGRLHVAVGATPRVSLTTLTGSCVRKQSRCELDSKRSTRTAVRDDAP